MFLFQQSVQSAEKSGGPLCLISINAEMEDVMLLVESLYTGKIEVSLQSLEKIIALCKTLQMKQEEMYYECEAKKALKKIDRRKVKTVGPIFLREQNKDGVLQNVLAGTFLLEDFAADTCEDLDLGRVLKTQGNTALGSEVTLPGRDLDLGRVFKAGEDAAQGSEVTFPGGDIVKVITEGGAAGTGSEVKVSGGNLGSVFQKAGRAAGTGSEVKVPGGNLGSVFQKAGSAAGTGSEVKVPGGNLGSVFQKAGSAAGTGSEVKVPGGNLGSVFQKPGSTAGLGSKVTAPGGDIARVTKSGSMEATGSKVTGPLITQIKKECEMSDETPEEEEQSGRFAESHYVFPPIHSWQDMVTLILTPWP